jgi:TIR domain-containing protein
LGTAVGKVPGRCGQTCLRCTASGPPRRPAPRPSPRKHSCPLSVTPPPPPVQAAPGRATPCCHRLRRAAAASWGSRQRHARASAAGGGGQREPRRQCRLKFLSPGDRWKEVIRRQIEQGDFFIACFSKEYRQRRKSYMNEEITQAIEQMRQLPTDQRWFIPVLLSSCNIPDFSSCVGYTDSSAMRLRDHSCALLPVSDTGSRVVSLPLVVLYTLSAQCRGERGSPAPAR